MHPCQEPKFNCVAVVPDGKSLCVVHQQHGGLQPTVTAPSKHWTERLADRQRNPWPTPWDQK